MPIIGVFFFDWRAANLLVLYFADFVLDIGICFALMMLLDPEMRAAAAAPPGAGGRVKQALAILLAFVVIVATFAFVFGMPVFGMFAMDPDLSLARLFGDARFRNGLAMHLLLSSWTFVQVYRYFSRMRAADAKFDVSGPVRGRFNFVVGRWLAVYVAGLSVPFFPTLMVVAYCAATVYIELFPRRFEQFLGPSDEDPPSRVP